MYSRRKNGSAPDAGVSHPGHLLAKAAGRRGGKSGSGIVV